jgi:DNA-binding transcriptional ArsR family regulator
MATASDPGADDLFIAMAHPLRRLILRTMHDGGDGEVSPRELSQRLEQPLSRLSYHVKVLSQCGAIELVNTQQVRGSTQHFYRSTVDAAWALMALEASAEPPRGRQG